MTTMNSDTTYKITRGDITLLITNRCGNQCKHCIPESGARLTDELETYLLIQGLQALSERFNAKGIAISGGEPFLRPEFETIYDAASSLFDITLFSSGIGLTRGIMSVLRRTPPKRFITSFYGLPTLHDTFCCRSGAFSDSERSLRFFNEIGVPTIANLICHRDNIDEILFVIDHLIKHDLVWSAKLLALSPLGRGKGIASLHVSNTEWIAFTSRLRERLAPMVADSQFALEIERHVREKDSLRDSRPSRCSVSSDTDGVFSSCVHIDANGDIYPCVMLLRNREFSIGNLRHLNEIDMDSYYHRVAEAVSSVKARNCIGCSAESECLGGCLGYHLVQGMDHRCEDRSFDLGCPTRYESLV